MSVVELDPAKVTPAGTGTTLMPRDGTLRRPFALNALVFWDKVALAALSIAASVLSVWNLTGAPSYQDDEGTYTAQAFAIQQGKLAPYTYWYDHPPLGWIQIAALNWLPSMLGAGDGTEIGATRYVIALFFVASAVLIYMVARRMEVRIPFAALAAVVFILSPLSLVLGRQVYLDNVGVPWLLLAFYLALSAKDALWHHIAAGVCFAVAVLSKETLAIFGPALLLALVYRPRWSNRVFSIVGFLITGGLLLAFYPLMALLRNELLSGPDHVSLQDALAYQFLERSGSGTIFEAGSSRAELLTGWFYFDKYVIAAGLVAALVCLLRPRARVLTTAIGCFALPIILGQGYLPAMYIIAVIPFLTLALGTACDIAWAAVGRIARRHPAHGRSLRAGLVTLFTVSILLMSVPQWFEQDRTLLTADANSDWRSTLTWVQNNIDRRDVVLSPYSMWHDLNASGWHDAWTMIATEKPDLDKQFETEHPGGWREIDWIIVGPSVSANIDNLGLTRAGAALEHSEEIRSFGDWSIHRVLKQEPQHVTDGGAVAP
jgi:hypothetical protein